MPITKSVKKSLRQSQKKAEVNKPIRSKARTMLKNARLNPTAENVSAAFSALDLAAKKNIFHKNKTSRLKSRLNSLANKPKTKDVAKPKKAPKTKTSKSKK
jgi:small subunit ribosomal protein S20